MEDSHNAHIAVAASDDKSFEQSASSADPMGGQQITDLLAYCCIVGLYRRYLSVVFPAVLIMRGELQFRKLK